MNWKLKLAISVAAIIGLPAGLCALYNAFTGLLNNELNTTISLYLSMVGIMVTVFLTWYVYRSEQRRNEITAKQEEADARRMVAAVLRSGLYQAIYRTGGYLKITDELLHATAPASRGLSIGQTQTLADCMRILQNIGDTELEDWGEANEKAWSFALRFLPEPMELFQKRILETKNWEWLVGGEIRDLLAALGTPLASPPEICQDQNGKPVYQEYEPGRYRVWTADGRLLLDGIVRGEWVIDGYAELKGPFDRYQYHGQYRDGRRNGYGVEYFTDGDKNTVSKEGHWKDGKLFDGMIYQVMLEEPDDDADEEEYTESYDLSPYDRIQQFETPEHVLANVDCFLPFRMCNIRMVQGEIQVIEDSIQTVEEFCANWTPRMQPAPPSAFPQNADRV